MNVITTERLPIKSWANEIEDGALKQAQRELSLDEEVSALNDLGVIHSIRGVGDLDEAPGAYKDIAEVVGNQKDLVRILVELSPLAVVKG